MDAIISKADKPFTSDVEVALDAFILPFDIDWRKQLQAGKKGKSLVQKEPTSQIYDYDEDMGNFMNPYLEKFNNLIKEHGEIFKIMFTYKAMLGVADVKRNNLFYEADMLNNDVYNAYMESWENVFFGRNKETGVDITSDTEGTVTSKRRIKDKTSDLINNKDLCID